MRSPTRRCDAVRDPTWRQTAKDDGMGRWTSGGLRVAADGFFTLVEPEGDITLGGGYHFRRHAVFPRVVCASDGLQSGNVCRVTRVGSRKPACWLEMGCG